MTRCKRLWHPAGLAAFVAGLGGLALGAAFAEDSPYRPQGGAVPPVVVELFTSQGCSSCPPADEFLAELAERDDVLALTFPITYWDELGWPDTLASPANTQRQMLYAKRTRKGRVYTPQMIIDGVFQAVGSRRDDVLGKIASRLAAVGEGLPIRISVADTHVEVNLPRVPPPTGAEPRQATVWLFPLSRLERVDIEGGENVGRAIAYAHVVRNIVKLGTWTGEEARLSHELSPADTGLYAYATVVQADTVGPVLGAGWVARAEDPLDDTPALSLAPVETPQLVTAPQ